MFDIHFFKKTQKLKKQLTSKQLVGVSPQSVENQIESYRSQKPHIFNIETTNNCNMKCIMCPRTNKMTRSISNLDFELFVKALDQVRPHSEEELKQFWKFIEDEYDVNFSIPGENSFYFYIVSKCLTLHGYGEPLLDKSLTMRISEATNRDIPTYLSCVPANLTVQRAQELMSAGLTVLKVSMDGLSESEQKRIRGPRNNFDQSVATITKIIELKKQAGYKTLIVPTMIQFKNDETAKQQHSDFLKLWEGKPVFAYVKSQDNRWLYEEDKSVENKSHYESQYCEYPWTSLTVMADGSVVPCTQDYNNEVCLGNIKEHSLETIWNSEKYREFRNWHISGNFPKGHKCVDRCDQKKLFEYIKS